MAFSMKVALLVALVCALVSSAASEGICDPLVPLNCMLPFPNNFWTKQDPSTPTGLRVVFPLESSPIDRSGSHFSLERWSRLDGFSISTAIFAHFPNVSLSNSRVPGWQDFGRSRDSDCPTILLDAETGELADHFAELDMTTPDAEERAFMMWPAQQLKAGHRYIVAMRGLRNQENQLIAASEAFAALRDGAATSDPDVENRRESYNEIFSLLASKGIARRDVQLAWEFTVGSEEYTTQAMFFMRDDAISRIPAGGPEVTVTEVNDNYSDRIFRRVEGEMTVPHYMTKRARPGCEMVVDENGIPIYQGEVEVRFTVIVPHVCAVAGAKCPILVYGHGLLGGQDQVTGGTQQTFANTHGYILAAVDMWGMSGYDVPSIMLATATNLGEMTIIPDRSHQGMLNQLLLMKLLTGDFANNPNFVFGGASVIDITKKFYWGISQGGILGAVYLAVSDDVNKAHLGVPGAPYPLLLARSVDFDTYFSIIKARYPDPVDRVIILTLLGLVWDRAEPSGYLNIIARNPEKRILIDYANGDAQVTYLGAYFMARSVNAQVFTNNVFCGNETTPIFGLPEVGHQGPVTSGSIIIGWEYAGIDCGPVVNTPPNKETDTHSRPRNDVSNQQNMADFFGKGEIYDICNAQGCYKS